PDTGLRRVRDGERLARDGGPEQARVLPGHVAGMLPAGRVVSEGLVPAQRRLLRATAQTELEPAVAQEVGGGSELGRLERVLVANVDHGRAELEPAGPRGEGAAQRPRARELVLEVVHAAPGPVASELLRADGDLDGLDERLPGGACLRAGYVLVVA